MTHTSASRGLLYSAPPSAESDRDDAEESADD